MSRAPLIQACRDRQRLREQIEREQADSKTQHAVVAHCALRAGAAGGAECQAGSRQRSICGILYSSWALVHAACH
jgi:hypothetical protein